MLNSTPRFLNTESLQSLNAILDTTCDELRIDKDSPYARSAREFLAKMRLRVTPAIAAGLTDHVWAMKDIVGLIDVAASKPDRPVAYKKKL